jgi:hypothetical protein
MIEMLIGAAIALAGVGVGRFLPARRKGPKPKPPVCGCGHELSHHEPAGDGDGAACHALMKTYLGLDHGGYRFDPCTCRRYTGPRILDPGYVARELADGS